jgi:hypothetical protein
VDYDVTIRLSEEARAFIYTVLQAGRAVKCATVAFEETVAPGYYGGSESMD